MILIMVPLLCKGQVNFNEVSQNQFKSILFGNKTISQLDEFAGSLDEFTNYYGESFVNISDDPEGEAKDFSNGNIIFSYLGFENEMTLVGIKVLNSQITVKIAGVNLKISDDSSVLFQEFPGLNVIEDAGNTGRIKVVFKANLNDNYVVLNIRTDTNEITSIKYFSPL
ncbi:MAG TPA: hypothetical protein DDY13_08680 [Cytophagales bacterium]|nr:hypothetical protein [Cytophagales bacterium]